MTIRASVERFKSGADQRLDYGEVEFSVLPRIGERVTIDGIQNSFTKTESGLVSGIEHLVNSDGTPIVTVFVNFE